MGVSIALDPTQPDVTRDYPVKFRVTFDLDVPDGAFTPNDVGTSGSTVGGPLELTVIRGVKCGWR